MAYDGGIVFLLFSRRIRPLSFPAAMTFNFMNKLMFNIGIFPYAMLGSLVLYLLPTSSAPSSSSCARRRRSGRRTPPP